jgi:dihydrolipoamide dehydrogenase
MVVVGGGVIGLELGSVYNLLGTEVTVVQFTDRVCPFVDKEIGLSFQNNLKKQGLKFLLEHSVVDGVNNKEQGVSLNLKNKAGETVKIDCDVALISIGRHAYTEGL